MRYVATVLFLLGLAAYVVSLFNIENSTGEIASDVGNALLLICGASLLLHRSWTEPRPSASAGLNAD